MKINYFVEIKEKIRLHSDVSFDGIWFGFWFFSFFSCRSKNKQSHCLSVPIDTDQIIVCNSVQSITKNVCNETLIKIMSDNKWKSIPRSATISTITSVQFQAKKTSEPKASLGSSRWLLYLSTTAFKYRNPAMKVTFSGPGSQTGKSRHIT